MVSSLVMFPRTSDAPNSYHSQSKMCSVAPSLANSFTKSQDGRWEFGNPIGNSATYKDETFPSASAALEAYICDHEGSRNWRIRARYAAELENLLNPTGQSQPSIDPEKVRHDASSKTSAATSNPWGQQTELRRYMAIKHMVDDSYEKLERFDASVNKMQPSDGNIITSISNTSTFPSFRSSSKPSGITSSASNGLPSGTTGQHTGARDLLTGQHMGASNPLTDQHMGASKPLTGQHMGASKPLTDQHMGASKPLTDQHTGASNPLTGQHMGASNPLTGQHMGASKPLTDQHTGASNPLTGQHMGASKPLMGQRMGASKPLTDQHMGASKPLMGQRMGASKPLMGQRMGASKPQTLPFSANVDTLFSDKNAHPTSTYQTRPDLSKPDYLEKLWSPLQNNSDNSYWHEQLLSHSQLNSIKKRISDKDNKKFEASQDGHHSDSSIDLLVFDKQRVRPESRSSISAPPSPREDARHPAVPAYMSAADDTMSQLMSSKSSRHCAHRSRPNQVPSWVQELDTTQSKKSSKVDSISSRTPTGTSVLSTPPQALKTATLLPSESPRKQLRFDINISQSSIENPKQTVSNLNKENNEVPPPLQSTNEVNGLSPKRNGILKSPKKTCNSDDVSFTMEDISLETMPYERKKDFGERVYSSKHSRSFSASARLSSTPIKPPNGHIPYDRPHISGLSSVGSGSTTSTTEFLTTDATKPKETKKTRHKRTDCTKDLVSEMAKSESMSQKLDVYNSGVLHDMNMNKYKADYKDGESRSKVTSRSHDGNRSRSRSEEVKPAHKDYLRQLVEDIEDGSSSIVTGMTEIQELLKPSHTGSRLPAHDRLGQDRLEQDRLGQERLGQDSLGQDRPVLPPDPLISAATHKSGLKTPSERSEITSVMETSPGTDVILTGDRPWEQGPVRRTSYPPDRGSSVTESGDCQEEFHHKKGGIVDRFLQECRVLRTETDQVLTNGPIGSPSHHKKPQPPGSMEALKNMLFTMQSMTDPDISLLGSPLEGMTESSTMADKQTDDKSPENNADVTVLQQSSEGLEDGLSPCTKQLLAATTSNGGDSLERALLHLNRLKTMVKDNKDQLK